MATLLTVAFALLTWALVPLSALLAHVWQAITLPESAMALLAVFALALPVLATYVTQALKAVGWGGASITGPQIGRWGAVGVWLTFGWHTLPGTYGPPPTDGDAWALIAWGAAILATAGTQLLYIGGGSKWVYDTFIGPKVEPPADPLRTRMTL